MNQTAELEKYRAEPEKKWVAKRQQYWKSSETWLLGESSAIECDTGRLNICWNAIERVLPIKSPKGMSYTYMCR